jgi:hypothetical protein
MRHFSQALAVAAAHEPTIASSSAQNSATAETAGFHRPRTGQLRGHPSRQLRAGRPTTAQPGITMIDPVIAMASGVPVPSVHVRGRPLFLALSADPVGAPGGTAW